MTLEVSCNPLVSLASMRKRKSGASVGSVVNTHNVTDALPAKAIILDDHDRPRLAHIPKIQFASRGTPQESDTTRDDVIVSTNRRVVS
jgi:hypothetical protein